MSLPTDLTQLEAYDFQLPDTLIARYPLENRDASRMMVIDRATGQIRHSHFNQLSQFMAPNDCLVMNDTRVLPNRLIGQRQGFTGKMEVFLLHPDNQDLTLWTALLRPTRRLTVGSIITFNNTTATVEVMNLPGGTHAQIKCHLDQLPNVEALMALIGQMPIPPYLGRNADDDDKVRYQTVYAQQAGSHAAPTAGLHFTHDILNQLKLNGIEQAFVTLNVSTGTFKPVVTAEINDHQMDAEWYTLPQSTVDAINNCKKKAGRVFAVGTTSAKTMETASKNQNGQLNTAEQGWSNLFITPGFSFNTVDALLTNFHLPKSTLMMLISAFMGYELTQKAYAAAVQEQYRFYSYGDCMLII